MVTVYSRPPYSRFRFPRFQLPAVNIGLEADALLLTSSECRKQPNAVLQFLCRFPRLISCRLTLTQEEGGYSPVRSLERETTYT